MVRDLFRSSCLSCPALPAGFLRRLRGGVPQPAPSDILGRAAAGQQHCHFMAHAGMQPALPRGASPTEAWTHPFKVILANAITMSHPLLPLSH